MKDVLGRFGLWTLCLCLVSLGCSGGNGDPCQTNDDCNKDLVCSAGQNARGTCVNPDSLNNSSASGGSSNTMTETGGNAASNEDASAGGNSAKDEDASAGGA